jgi:hypothetical protein
MSDPAAAIDQGFKTLIITGRSKVSHLNGTGRSNNNKILVSYISFLFHTAYFIC